ncbi:MAG: 50S ribosomal protein L15 [Patescibacteria group bacterium]|nr:50S ribosomal protein L15 [Patescibacteria group bacterium]
MKLSEMKKLRSFHKPAKVIGRGHGSGKGKTSGRGIKGQKAREKVAASFQISTLVRRLPQRRGVGNPPKLIRPVEISLATLDKNFKDKEVVDTESLIKKGLVKATRAKAGAKVLGTGEIHISLTVKLPVTKSAKQKIEKAGGQVELMKEVEAANNVESVS